MKNFVSIFVLLIFLTSNASSNEVSLLDQDQSVVQGKDDVDQEVSDEGPQDEEDEDSLDQVQDHSMENSEDFQFQEMNDFINQENEKIKDIKLLNLDLQKADLELKKREIEQKIDRLSKVSMPMIKRDDTNGSAVDIGIPILKVISIFVSDNNKKAVISFNGVNRQVHEGDKIESYNIQNIDPQRVIIKDSNGQTQELYFS